MTKAFLKGKGAFRGGWGGGKTFHNGKKKVLCQESFCPGLRGRGGQIFRPVLGSVLTLETYLKKKPRGGTFGAPSPERR